MYHIESIDPSSIANYAEEFMETVEEEYGMRISSYVKEDERIYTIESEYGDIKSLTEIITPNSHDIGVYLESRLGADPEAELEVSFEDEKYSISAVFDDE